MPPQASGLVVIRAAIAVKGNIDVCTGVHLTKPDTDTHAIGLDANGVLRFDSNEVAGGHLVVIITSLKELTTLIVLISATWAFHT